MASTTAKRCPTVLPGILLLATYAAITAGSDQFRLATQLKDRPIPAMLMGFAIAFALYLWGLRRGLTAADSISAKSVLGFAVAFRIVVLLSTPILEIDIYRYIWDGNAVVAGVNPYRFSPQQIQQGAFSSNRDLKKLVRLGQSTASLKSILDTIHFGDLPSPYPPVSQAVFGLSALLTPDDASVATHLLVMKSLIVLFDLASLWLLIRMLALLRKPVGWAIAYGWCPVVLKEFANSGHLDSITVFFTMAAAYAVVVASKRGGGASGFIFSASLLALATAGKFYPLILTPVFFVMWWRGRVEVTASTASLQPSLLRAMAGLCCYVLATGLLLFPMFYEPPGTGGVQHKTAGLAKFLREWEINDFVFMVVIENLKPSETLLADGQEVPVPFARTSWLQVTPPEFRTQIVNSCAARFSIPRHEVPFFITRVLTSVAFGVILLWMCIRLARGPSLDGFLQTVFLTLAIFWFLSPTQNPWYWTWALAFIPFTKDNKAWLWVSGLTLIYYARFWFKSQFVGIPVAGTRYMGVDFFDYVITCVEFGPWLVWFAIVRTHRFLTDRAKSGD
jgi:hypothetical protein